MFKKFLPFAIMPLLAAGCATGAKFTNLTPTQQVRTTNNLYMVEVALDSRQQTLRWDSIRPQIAVGSEYYSMRPTKLMSNRWEGLLPVPPDASVVHYHYKFGFEYNAFGNPKTDSAVSREYTLRILDKPQ
ncbi:conserved exported hypothetical protein [Verrucomicrobia bacterium]|nr:conserved exported hypothetical protein [Verrucomicrobiota bacterium]